MLFSKFTLTIVTALVSTVASAPAQFDWNVPDDGKVDEYVRPSERSKNLRLLTMLMM